jgi:thymidylate kinase
VRSSYLERAAAEPQRIIVLDAVQSADALCALMMSILKEQAWIS